MSNSQTGPGQFRARAKNTRRTSLEIQEITYNSGMLGLLGRGGKICLDPASGQIRWGRDSLDLGAIKVIEVRQGFLTLGTSGSWWTIDLEQCRDEKGPFLKDGVLSGSAIRMVQTLKDSAAPRHKAPQPGRQAAFR